MLYDKKMTSLKDKILGKVAASEAKPIIKVGLKGKKTKLGKKKK